MERGREGEEEGQGGRGMKGGKPRPVRDMLFRMCVCVFLCARVRACVPTRPRDV